MTGGLLVVFTRYNDIWRRMRKAAHEGLNKGVVRDFHETQTRKPFFSLPAGLLNLHNGTSIYAARQRQWFYPSFMINLQSSPSKTATLSSSMTSSSASPGLRIQVLTS
ncbi:hypothetical protein BJV77DRAFT_1080024 [Russula vinacea]|nr:hypothetical protein BJV77DRAFT_1080024 [Russula vinacea]